MARAQEPDLEVLSALEASGDQWQFRSRVGAHQYLLLYDLVRKYISPGARVLDWGAATGHFSYFLLRSGYRATGYSLFPDHVPESLRDLGFDLVVGSPADPVNLPFDDESFDAVSSIGVLEHVRETGGDESASLREIRRILRPNGIFLCYHFPNRYGWIDAVVRVTPGTPHHEFRFTQSQIRSLLRSADLTLVEMRPYAFLPRNPLHRLPNWIAESEKFATTYDRADRLLARLLPLLCTNHYFVASKQQPAA